MKINLGKLNEVMGTPGKMSFTITIDFSLAANYRAYPCALLALHQVIVQRLMYQQRSNDCNLRAKAQSYS